MSERHEFQAGDPVPEWLMRAEPASAGCRITFVVDAVVERAPDYWLIRPAHGPAEAVIHISDASVRVSIVGPALTLWNTPEGIVPSPDFKMEA